MLQVIITNQFKRDVKTAKKRRKDLKKLTYTIALIAEEKPLPPKFKNHKLSDVYQNC